MPSGQVIANNVLRKMGLFDPGGGPSASDSQYVLDELNNMWQIWGVDEGFIYAIISNQYPLTANVGSYKIGSGATFDAPRPGRIYKANVTNSVTFTGGTTSASKTITAVATAGLFVGMAISGTGIPAGATITAVVLNTSVTSSINSTATASVSVTATGGNRTELKIVEGTTYYAHNDLGAISATPDEIYPDFNDDANGYATIYIWPVIGPQQSASLELVIGVNFTAWTLPGNYQIPQGYQDAIEWTLAFRLSGFGMAVSSDTMQIIISEAKKAEARIREMNSRNRQLPPEAVMAPGSQTAPVPVVR